MESLKNKLQGAVNEEKIQWQRMYAANGVFDEYDVPSNVINQLNQLNAKHSYGSSKSVIDKDCTGR